jgi:glycosyltransferase involved in cell wall biosynthesis
MTDVRRDGSGTRPTATVLICTYNRASLLGETLDTLAGMQVTSLDWDVLVVDNNSTDGTAEVVRSRQAGFPAPLVYMAEPRQGKSYALNTGLAATTAEFVFFTDDDVRVSEAWLEAGAKPMMEDPAVQYTGGPVRPIWGGPRPAWLPEDRGNLWGAIATLDYGSSPFVFEARQKIPIGANMAVRRSLLDSVGGFHPDLGRTGQSLLGQEQAEFFCRTRRRGAQGLYVPAMSVEHHVPSRRLTRDYFRRWWWWKGVSRARLHQLQPDVEPNLDIAKVKRIAGLPKYVLGDLVRHAGRFAGAVTRRDGIAAAEHEMALAYYLGYGWEAWRQSRRVRQG